MIPSIARSLSSSFLSLPGYIGISFVFDFVPVCEDDNFVGRYLAPSIAQTSENVEGSDELFGPGWNRLVRMDCGREYWTLAPSVCEKGE